MTRFVKNSPHYVPTIRLMNEADLEAVSGIEERNQECPWRIESFRECLAAEYQCRVAEQSGKIAGFIIFSTAGGEGQLLNLCVDQHRRRNGLGRMLVQDALRTCHETKCRVMYLEVRSSNQAATAFYRHLGFRPSGCLFTPCAPSTRLW